MIGEQINTGGSTMALHYCPERSQGWGKATIYLTHRMAHQKPFSVIPTSCQTVRTLLLSTILEMRKQWHTFLTVMRSNQPPPLYVHVHLTLKSGRKNARWTKPMLYTRKKLHKHPANQNMFLFAPLETYSNWEAFVIDVSIGSASLVMNCTIYMN